jgi:hypothetical protein
MTETNVRRLLALLGCEDPVRGSNGWLSLACPFAEETHEKGCDSKRKFAVHTNAHGLSGYNCFVCGATGSMTTLAFAIGAMRGEDYGHIAAIASGLEIPGEYEDFDADTALQTLQIEELDSSLMLSLYPLAWEERPAREYLIRRGISEATAALLDLRFDPERKNIMFPVFGKGRKLYGFAGRIIYDNRKPKTYNYNHLRTSLFLLGEHLMRPGYDKVIVEGQFAYAHLVEIGAREFCDPIATFGCKLSTAQANKLIDAGDTVHLLYDDDVAGSEGIYGAFNKTTGEYRGGGALDTLKDELPVTVPVYPARTGDPDELTADELYDMLFKIPFAKD